MGLEERRGARSGRATRQVRLSLCAALLALLPAAGAAALDMRCVQRDGRCMAVTVNGQKAVKIGKATKKQLAGMNLRGAELRHHVSETRYELTGPVRGALDVQADRSADSKDWFGEGRSFEVMVVPLSDVELKTREQVGRAEGVSAGGSAPLTIESVLESDRLPPGPYLLVVRLSGDENWDRMTLFVRVE